MLFGVIVFFLFGKNELVTQITKDQKGINKIAIKHDTALEYLGITVLMVDRLDDDGNFIPSPHGQFLPSDGNIILHKTKSGEIVGLTMLDPKLYLFKFWIRHSDRNLIPKDIVKVVDEWIRNNG